MFGLTDTQRELFELEQYSGTGSTCLAADIFFEGEMNIECALASVNELIDKNDIFHFKINNTGKETVWDYVENIAYDEYSAIKEFDDEQEYLDWVHNQIKNVPSVMDKLYFFTVVRRNKQLGVFLIINHIIADAWTLSMIGENLVKLYNAKLTGGSYSVDLNSYIEVMQDEKEYIDTERFLKDKEFWKQQMEKCNELVVLANHPAESMKSDRVQIELSCERSKRIMDFCKDAQISEYVLFLSAIGAVFHEQTQANSFYIGSTLLNRTGRKRRSALGLLANTVPIYFSYKNKGDSLHDYMGAVADSVHDVFRHQRHTYNRILKENRIGKIFDVSLNYQSASILDDISIDMTFYPAPEQVESLIVHVFLMSDHKYIMMFDYQKDTFEKWEMEALQQHMLNFIDYTIDNWSDAMDIAVDSVDFITDEEKELVLKKFNDNYVSVTGLTIDEMFEEQVAQYPEKIAIILEHTQVSYETVDKRANYVANQLLKKGIGRGDFVAICASKSVETIVGILGALKCGAAFVPIDLEYPNDRIDYIISDCNPAAVLGTAKVEMFDSKVAFVAVGTEELEKLEKVQKTHTKNDIAYMIYTSGTTGRPKGVLVEHHGVESLRAYFRNDRGICEEDVVMQFASFSFDAAISEITMSILSGATMCIVTENIRNDIDMLENYLKKNKVTAGIFPPQYLSQLKNVPFKLLISAGSESNHAIVEKFGGKNKTVYSNDYGPTEATVCATAWKYEGGRLPKQIPIGRPITNKQIYILRNNKVCGIGVPGELCIAGEGIARGYHNQPELTVEKFVDNPFGEGKLYRTGDRARWDKVGEIQFLGRIDNQVKIRGFRIEVAEIESIIRSAKGIKEAAVVVRKNELQNDKYLEAYYVVNGTLRYEELITHMRNKLPDYMIPSHIYQVTEIPLNRNGKVDVTGLDKYIIERKKKKSEPKNEIECFVLNVFKEVIGNSELGMDDNFFEEGGDSIKAIGIVAKLKEKGIYINVKNIIRASVIRELCKMVSVNPGGLSIEMVLRNRDKSEKYLSLTGTQKEIYLGAELDIQKIAYNVPMIVKFNKRLNLEKAQSAVNELQKRHISLRTGFINSDDGLLQFYRKPECYALERVVEEDVETAFAAFFKPFDLENDKLFRMRVADIDSADYLMFDSHHIIVDGLSMNILFDEFVKLYNEEELPTKQFDFDDYVKWSIGEESAKIAEKDLDYWEKVFAEGVEKTLIPTDYERKGESSNEGETVYRTIEGELCGSINNFCVKNNVTPFMLFMSAYSVLMHKITSSGEVIIGVPSSGRFVEQTSNMVGMFVSSLPFKINIETEKEFIGLVNNVGDNLLEVLQHQNCTMSQIAERLGISAENGQNPFFSTMFGVNDVVNSERAASLEYELVNFEQNQAKFDITLDANRERDKWELILRYNKNLYKNSRMKQFVDRYIQILKQVVVNPNMSIRDIRILSDKEQEKLLFENNDNKVVFDKKDSNIVALFHEQVIKTPDSVALVFNDSYITYKILDNYSNALADILVERGIGKGKVLPLLTERSIEMLVMELAIMKVGAGFCPMDPAWPQERKEIIIKKLQAAFVLTGPGCYNSDLEQLEISIKFLENVINERIKSKALLKEYDGKDIEGADTFYVIYTSGSTGEPKGVVVPYRGIINRLMWMNKALGKKSSISVLLTTNYVYDSSIWQFYWPLINGGKSVIPKPQDMLTSDYLLDIIQKEQIRIVDFVPSVFNSIVDGMESSESESHALDSLVWVILGGEEIKPKAVNRFLALFPHLQCINLYGPTEASIGCIYKILSGHKNITIPIGKPISNVDILILDKDMNLVPEGICGEIYIGGICLADGYFGDAEKTVESFVDNPFPQINSDRLYKTGDLAKWDENGEVFYLGRSDSQVKIRGFRIELQEIEAKILNYPGIKECIVQTIERQKDDKALCAYIVGDVAEADIKKYLTAQLPGYMVPSYYVNLDKIPVSASGKTNRKMLPMPELTIKKCKVVEPVNTVEKELLTAWKVVLKQDEISTEDNYFEIGGDSIKALQMVSMLRRKNMEFTMPQLFANPTITQLAKVIEANNADDYKSDTYNSEDVYGELELSPIQKRYFEKYDLDKYFNQAVMLENRRGWDREVLEKSLQAVVDKHPMLSAEYTVDEFGNVKQVINRNEKSNKNMINITELENVEFEDGEMIERLQVSLVPLKKVFACTLFCDKKNGKSEYLLIAANHLVVDAVSMRILIRDIISAYEALATDENCDIKTLIGAEEKTYKSFVASISEAKNNYHFYKNREYWIKTDSYKDSGNIISTFKNRNNITIQLNADVSNGFLLKANLSYGTKTEELILTAVLKAMEDAGLDMSDDVVFDMEAMGRNITGNEMDFAETVGWFTAIYPVHFNKGYKSVKELIIEVKEKLRQVPDKGVGYQLLDSNERRKDSKYCFNYLGDFSIPDISENISLKAISNSSMIHQDMPVPYAMDFSVMIRDGIITISIDYVKDIYDENKITVFKETLVKVCNRLFEELCQIKDVVKTPSDFFSGVSLQLSMNELQKIFDIAGNSIEKIYPLSPTQTGMLFHTIADGSKKAYFEQNYLKIRGNIDFENLKNAYKKLIEYNDIFRTVFVYDELSSNYQVVKKMDEREIYFEEIDIRTETTDEQDEIINAYCIEDKVKGFDLQRGPLMRVQAYRVSNDTWRLIWSDHHILMDGMCLGMILEKVTSYYEELQEDKEVLNDNISQYGDYIIWLQDQDTEKAKEYWKNEVIDFEKSKELYRGGDKKDKGQKEYKKNLDKKVVAGLKAIAAENGLTLNAVMQAAWAVTLMRYQDSLDVVYGSVVSGRSVPIANIDRMIGLFISTLPIRIRSKEDTSFIEIAKQMLQKCAQAEINSYYPLSKIQKYSEYGSQLFDHIFVFENFDFLNSDNGGGDEFGKKGFQIIEVSANEITNYDLTVVVVPKDDILISFMYKKAAFNDEFMRQLMDHYIYVLQQIVENKQITFGQIEVLDESDYEDIDFAEAFETGFPDVSIVELFHDQVKKFPERIAIQFKDKCYTYSDVDRLSNQVAGTLLVNGIKTEDIIGILMDKSAKAVISAIGILKAGGAYMPLEPSYPAERLEFMIEDSKAPFVLIDGKTFDVNVSCRVIDITKDLTEADVAPSIAIKPKNLAYIIYTSGTTGKPKGTMILHRNVVRLFVSDRCLYDFTENDVWVMFHSFCFDFSVWEMYGALLFGGRLIIISKHFARNTYKFMKLLEEEGVTVLNQTPSAFNALSLQLEMEPSIELKVRYLIFGGEKLHPSILKYFHERFTECKIINMYGITETTVHVTYKEITDYEISENISDIGEPIPTLGISLVDSRLKPVPKGMQGEIIVWGQGVCRGYLNRPELTASKFVDIEQGGYKLRIYRSGDAGRYIENGLEYIGRIDQQVKIRGHRIELAEIKNSILKNSNIEDCVVIVDADAEDNKSIIVYYQLKNGCQIDVHELRSFEEEHLPSYMVPAHFIQIDGIPLNVNGKVDKKALPKPEIQSDLDNFEVPETAFQKYIASVWEEVLNYAPIGIDDNYFEIGGDSIKVIKILSKVHADGYHFEVGDLFAHPTIREFEVFIKKNKNSYQQREVTGDMKLTAIQNVLAKDSAAKTNQYNQMIMFKSKKRINITSLQKALKALVKHHDVLRSNYVENGENKLLRIMKSEEISDIADIRVEDISRGSEVLSIGEMVESPEQIQIEKICTEEQEKITLNSKKLYSLTLIKTDDGDYIFFVIHHMIVDVVSWNILAEDLTKIYMAAEKGEEPALPDKTMSFKEWSELLHSEELREEVYHCYESTWREIARDKNTSIWNVDNYGLFADTKEIEFDIPGDVAESLRVKAFNIASANMEETLVSVVSKAIAEISNKQNIAFAMESSGRFVKNKEIDLSRTVGWFTAIYPIVVKAELNPITQICNVKETRRKLKNIEFTYSVVAREKISDVFVAPEISFNYLGRIEESANSFKSVNIPCGPAVGSNIKRDYAVDISCKLVGSGINNRLHITIAYSNTVVDEEWVYALKNKIVDVINNYTEALDGMDKKVNSPSDYGIDISMEELQYLEAIYGNQAEDYVKMTPMQKGMLFHVISKPDDDSYYEKLEMQISGKFSLEILREALIRVQAKYPALRTAFVSNNISDPVQVILKKGFTDIEIVDGTICTENELESIRNSFNKKSFIVSKGLLSKALLIQTDESKYEVIWQFHHLILDGWSVSQVLEEIFRTYYELTDNNGEVKETLAISNISTKMYEYIGKQNKYYAKKFWKNYLDGREINTRIPFEESKTNVTSAKGNNMEMDFYVDELSTKALADITKQNVTIASVVLSAWGLLLQMMSGAEEAVFGSVVSGRNIQLENVNHAVGMFINTVPICTALQENETFIDSVKRLQEDLIKVEKYSYYPLYEIQSDINEGDPIISHVVAFENYPVNEMLKKGLAKGTDLEFTVDKVTLQEHTIYGIGAVFTPGEKLKLNLSYNSGVISERNCKKLGEVFCNIINQVAENPFIRIKDINLIDKETENELVQEYNASDANKLSLIELFERAARENADCIAVKDSLESYSYKELDAISNGLALQLVDSGVSTGSVVALMCGPGGYQAIGILGIMKSNAVYLPIDTSLPYERIKYMLDNSGAVRIVTDAAKVTFAEKYQLPVTVIDKNVKALNRREEVGENAYIIYTSGTTGKPKGVLVSKKNIVAAISWRSNEYMLNNSDAILQLFSYSFDGFMTSFFTPIISGAKVVFVEDVLDLKKIGEIIEEERITHFISVPMLCQSVFENLNREQLQSLRIITTAGDRLGEQTYQIIKNKNPEVEIVNEYGPTECTVVSTIKRNVTIQDIAANNIGRVIDNCYFYIVDKYMHMLPAGIEGEIVLGGAGVSKGYINAPELTEKVFVKDPWREGKIVYRTGDKGKLLDNGEIVFMGRVDKQVKLRGYRIETQGIETIMESMDKIDNAAVAVKGDKLVAYYIGTETPENIKSFVATKVPKYMIPNVITKLDKIPQTRIGKTDYKKLPEPEIMQCELAMPDTLEEKVIWDIWENVLGHSNFGITDNFFDVGGNSIRLMSVYGQLNKLYPDRFTVASLFSHTTVKDISNNLVLNEQQTDVTLEELTEDDILNALNSDDIDLDELISKL